MAAAVSVKVYVVFDRAPVVINCPRETTAEDLCIILCKRYDIPPLTRTLFALRVRGTKLFLKDNYKFSSGSSSYELRIRYKVPKFSVLITLDETTFDYYFQQARNDINADKIPEIKYSEYKKELLGLGITDMIRSVLEEKLPLKEVINNYKRYIPSVIVRSHGKYSKKHAKNDLPKLCSYGHKVNYVKTQYVQQLYALAPNYLAEEYDDVAWKNGENILVPVLLMVSPFHPHEPGIRMFNTIDRKWSHVCSIEELIYLTRHQLDGDLTLEVSRRGTPVFFKFSSEEQLSSFISVCDGYYRLMVKWTFNLSKDDETPSLKELHRLKCHGPVGGAFSHRKLEEKRAKRHGSFILRQCQERYNVYYLDVCSASCTTEFYKIEFKGMCYEFLEENYDSIEKLIRCHQNPDGRIYLKECIPPSEYDKSQLLLCAQTKTTGVRIDQAELQEILKDNKSPRCLPNKDILLIQGSEKFGTSGLTLTYKAHWKLDETKKLLVAFKTLQRDQANDFLKDFIELGSKWSCVQSASIVRLYGITLSSPTAMVLEYMPSGRFDEYLREHGNKIKTLDLKKVAASLARALWDLSEAGVVHGFIRCERLLLSIQDGDRLVVKLSGPSLRQYTPKDVHWMPVQFFRDMNQAKKSVLGDIWAFGTTLWEVFSYGQSPAEQNPVLTEKSYEVGDRLLKPKDCPVEVWTLIRECWTSNPLRPQEIMRDMNHMLHCEYIPSYAVISDILVRTDNTDPDEVLMRPDEGSNFSIRSDSSVPSTNGSVDDYSLSDRQSSGSMDVMAVMPGGLDGSGRSSASSLAPRGAGAGAGAGEPDPDSAAPTLMVSIMSEGVTYLVTPLRKIGSGNYGSVYVGWMELDNQESRRKEVAIKKLNARADRTNHREDFENELVILKSLAHENIVEILGYAFDGGSSLLVLEYLEEGSLYYYLKFQGHNLRTSHLIKYAKDIASGMNHISAKNILHRDLATRNILVVNKNHVKISDFGLARLVPRDTNEYILRTNRLLPIKWYAPESAVEPYRFTEKSDVWSYGVTAWEIFTRAKVEVPDFDIKRPTERASAFPIPEGCSSNVYRHLMKDCWELDPAKRPKFIDLWHKCRRFAEEYNDGV